ncbi:MAG: TIR domain-containing protein [Thermosynechococcaceae cyanobacterium]
MPTLNPAPQTILFLAANPKDTVHLRLDQELRDIDEGLQRAQKRDQFNLEQRWAVRPRDIQRAMLDLGPNILHFSGHGEGETGLVFEDEIGNTKLVDGEALAGLFELFADQLNCVVLNGCYTEVQAKAIAQHIPYVIGMNKAIGDKAAIAFSVGFYDALGAGRDVEFAFKLGCAAIRMEGIAEHLTPVLIKKPTEPVSQNLPHPPAPSETSQQSVPIPDSIMPIEVFISYSHQDDKLKDALMTHLANLKRQKKITAWQDRAIEGGQEWEAQIKKQLESAQIILLLISPDFMASDYCYDVEMERAIARHDEGTARVIPIIIRPCDWKDSPFSKLQVLPKDALPVTQWGDRDEAFRIVAQGIRKAIEKLNIPSPKSNSTDVSLTIMTKESTSLTSGERRRLETERDELQDQYDSLSEEIQFLQQSESTDDLSPKDRFRLKKQIEQAKQKRQQLSEKITILENRLQQ